MNQKTILKPLAILLLQGVVPLTLTSTTAMAAIDTSGPVGSGGSGASFCSPYLLGDTGPDAISKSAVYNTSNTNTLSGYNCSTTNAQLTPYCWHLPSKAELQYLYEQKTIVGGFANNKYWSSNDYSSALAWNQSFGRGKQNIFDKAKAYLVRAVRAF